MVSDEAPDIVGEGAQTEQEVCCYALSCWAAFAGSRSERIAFVPTQSTCLAHLEFAQGFRLQLFQSARRRRLARVAISLRQSPFKFQELRIPRTHLRRRFMRQRPLSADQIAFLSDAESIKVGKFFHTSLNSTKHAMLLITDSAYTGRRFSLVGLTVLKRLRAASWRELPERQLKIGALKNQSLFRYRCLWAGELIATPSRCPIIGHLSDQDRMPRCSTPGHRWTTENADCLHVFRTPPRQVTTEREGRVASGILSASARTTGMTKSRSLPNISGS